VPVLNYFSKKENKMWEEVPGTKKKGERGALLK